MMKNNQKGKKKEEMKGRNINKFIKSHKYRKVAMMDREYDGWDVTLWEKQMKLEMELENNERKEYDNDMVWYVMVRVVLE